MAVSRPILPWVDDPQHSTFPLFSKHSVWLEPRDTFSTLRLFRSYISEGRRTLLVLPVPNLPCMPHPHKNSSPLPCVITAELASPASIKAILIAVYLKKETSFGRFSPVSSPWPSLPLRPLPHEYSTYLELSTAKQWCAPHAISAMFMKGRPCLSDLICKGVRLMFTSPRPRPPLLPSLQNEISELHLPPRVNQSSFLSKCDREGIPTRYFDYNCT